DRACRNFQPIDGLAVQSSKHPVADIGEIRCPRTEIGILGGFIRSNFRIQRIAPGRIGRSAGSNGLECRPRQLLVLKKSNVRQDDFGFSRLETCSQIRERGLSFGDCCAQMFWSESPGTTWSPGGIEPEKPSDNQAGRSGHAPETP